MSGLETAYRIRFDSVLQPLANAIEKQLHEYFASEPRIDRISARAKSVERFLTKAKTVSNGSMKYSEPLNQIQDQIGARIVTFYSSDVNRISAIVNKYYRSIESIDLIPDSEWKFGYFGRHYILIVPSDVIDPAFDKNLTPAFFELQVKTLFQHAWSEANHDLGYKPGTTPLPSEAERRLAFASAQAWGADWIFNELFQERTN
jgi:putative GTP pyrophosphokinase